MADFIAGVNRLLRTNNVIRGDDDAITTFSDTQHSSDIQNAQIAIQNELSEITSDRLIDNEKASNTITLADGTRTYALQTDFIRFYGTNPSFYDSVDNVRIYEWKGGEDRLKDQIYTYETDKGAPSWWYWDNTTVKQVAFFNVPDSTYDGRSLAYKYEKSVNVTDATDTLPFHNNEEYYAFIEMASRRFYFSILGDINQLMEDATYKNAKARLYNLMKPTNPNKRYGHVYR